MNELVEYLFEAYATFYTGIILTLALWGVMGLIGKLLDKLSKVIYRQIKAIKRSRQNQNAAEEPSLD